jgi:hypothetical protein
MEEFTKANLWVFDECFSNPYFHYTIVLSLLTILSIVHNLNLLGPLIILPGLMINSPSFFFNDTLSIKFGGSIILGCLWHPSPLSFFSAMGWKRRGHGYVVSHPSFLN